MRRHLGYLLGASARAPGTICDACHADRLCNGAHSHALSSSGMRACFIASAQILAHMCPASRHLVQQLSLEGCTLLMQVKAVVKELFCGGSSYVTRCRQCERESAHSSSVSDFFELDLQVRCGPCPMPGSWQAEQVRLCLGHRGAGDAPVLHGAVWPVRQPVACYRMQPAGLRLQCVPLNRGLAQPQHSRPAHSCRCKA